MRSQYKRYEAGLAAAASAEAGLKVVTDAATAAEAKAQPEIVEAGSESPSSQDASTPNSA